ncbi:MAG: phosphatase PAP2 family protein [Cytophagales bacterium]
MNQNNFSLKPYYTYLGMCIAYFILIGSIVVFVDKGYGELYVNQYYNPYFDVFFAYFTNLGDGWFYTIFNVLLLFVGFYETLIALVSVLITTIIVQYFKLSLFNQAPRPSVFFTKYFHEKVIIHYADGVNIHETNSFPSGHTTTALCMGMILAFLIVNHLSKNKNLWLSLAFFFCFLIGFSRVYLMQHFFIDTLAGTFIGTSIPLLVIAIFEKNTTLKTHPFWSQSLLRLRK